MRYGNVVGSRGSVIPLFKAQAPTGVVTVTDERMTRFWITLEEATQFVIDCAARMVGGEVFVPKIPSMKLVDLAEALAPDCRREVIGIRPGEKLHELLVTSDESRHCYEHADSYVIYPGVHDLEEPCPGARRDQTAGRLLLHLREQRAVAHLGGDPRDGSSGAPRPRGVSDESFLPYGRQEIGEADIAAVVDALRAPMITQGPRIAEFEGAVCDYTGARHAVAFSSGTAALHAAAAAAGWDEGDEVLVPPITFVASANCALYVGARPRFVDIDRRTWNLDTAAASEAASEERVKGIVAVSFAGLPVDLASLNVPDRVVVIEDAAHAIGGRRHGRPVGGPGGADMTTFSFHPVKSLTTGEGGLVTTESDELAERLLRFRTHGIPPERNLEHPEGPWHQDMVDLGFNYRITDIQCALGISQLARLDGWIARRNELAGSYRELLADEDRIELPPEAPEGSLHGRHLFPIRVRGGADQRLAVFRALREAGIGVQVHYIPTYRFSHYRRTLGYPQDTCPEAERYYGGAISLPMFPGVREEDVERVAAALKRALG